MTCLTDGNLVGPSVGCVVVSATLLGVIVGGIVAIFVEAAEGLTVSDNSSVGALVGSSVASVSLLIAFCSVGAGVSVRNDSVNWIPKLVHSGRNVTFVQET